MSAEKDTPIPRVRAMLERGTYSWMWVVTSCPYCGKTHEHYGGPFDGDPQKYINCVTSAKCDKADLQPPALDYPEADLRYVLSADQPISVQKNTAIVRWFVEEGYAKGNLAVVDEVIAPDIVCHLAIPEHEDASSRASVNLILTSLRTAFPDLQVKVENLIALGDMVLARVTFRGTHLGTFMDISSTGLAVTWTRIMLYRLADGKIAEYWSEIDPLSTSQQPNVVARPGLR
jgi:predicted ester cyclase